MTLNEQMSFIGIIPFVYCLGGWWLACIFHLFLSGRFFIVSRLAHWLNVYMHNCRMQVRS